MVRRPALAIARLSVEEPEEPTPAHTARKALFARALARGSTTRAEIDELLPPGALSEAERWLLFYSLRAAGVEVLEAAPAAGVRAVRPARASKKRCP